ncbi:MAG: ubiquitin-like small modifier protein 1 [Candidatus Eiseniibacteriota bacterium]
MPATPSISFQIPGALSDYCGGRTILALEAATVRAALERLEREQPALHRNICDETGAVRRHINIFVNSDNVRDGRGVETALEPGDVVTILPAVSGG